MQSILIMECPQIFNRFFDTFREQAEKHHLLYMEFETMYDWMITRAMSNILHLTVRGHVRNTFQHDVLEVIYSEIGYELEKEVRSFIIAHGIEFLTNETIKMLVTYREIIIVRSR